MIKDTMSLAGKAIQVGKQHTRVALPWLVILSLQRIINDKSRVDPCKDYNSNW